MKQLSVKLSTATGCVFSGSASSLDVRTGAGSIHVNSKDERFLNMRHATQVTLQTPDGPRVYALDNAVTGLKGRHFTVLAESIRLIMPATMSDSVSSSPPETSSKPIL